MVSAEAQLALTLYNQMNLKAVVKMKMIHNLCLLLVTLSALRCLRDDYLYFKSASRALIKKIYEKITTCCFVFSLDFMLTLKTLLFYLEKYPFRQLKLMLHPY